MRNSVTGISRGFIIFAQVFGTMFAIIGLIAYCALLDDVIKGLGNGSNDNIVAKASAGAIMALIVYFVWKSVWSCVVIIRSMNEMDDFTLSANKWIISALSLTVGGFFTPFIISSFPNIKVSATIKPKPFLTKAFGMFMVVGAPLAMLTYGIYMRNNMGGAAQGWTIAVFAISGFLLVLGALNVGFFYQKNANQKYESSTFMKLLANTTLVIVTLELVFVMLEAVLRLLANLYRMIYEFSQNGFLWGLLALVNFMFVMIYVLFVIRLTWETITGIWADEVEFNVFEPLKDYQKDQKNSQLA
ncbi:hypothetical protein LD125_00171 [Mesoplasma sp. JKS002658]|uniref:hypothetical protein n=1 Tax=Mesoplasma whartonense TaxID=2878854 RepID=UPI002022AC00|nr:MULTISPECIES: hypothetical protein [unclassified Mesoplasma]MCL8211518.1 hypothetical protein [Mesoplasma sp. JKS002664]MCL8211978.1 hypothetical protein [Mesoplasma sp. JKS002662]MCL8213917.1 hypothetical protein [Mesoplasma sp. JKS002658]MCL8214883.1 hypothetical protein [Mesoplasma sp. JKS002663]MCL8215236.1 hypothetical protein [Mesoplasma sp. JKS002659]